MRGLIHIYCGDGKGKTSAALGLALRANGCGRKTVIVQFLKGSASGELECLEKLGITVLRCAPCRFANEMTENERVKIKAQHEENLNSALNMEPDVLILDEALDALKAELVDREILENAVFSKPENREIILTGHAYDEELFKAADYITEMKKIKHPFDSGIAARRGIEY